MVKKITILAVASSFLLGNLVFGQPVLKFRPLLVSEEAAIFEVGPGESQFFTLVSGDKLTLKGNGAVGFDVTARDEEGRTYVGAAQANLKTGVSYPISFRAVNVVLQVVYLTINNLGRLPLMVRQDEEGGKKQDEQEKQEGDGVVTVAKRKEVDSISLGINVTIKLEKPIPAGVKIKVGKSVTNDEGGETIITTKEVIPDDPQSVNGALYDLTAKISKERKEALKATAENKKNAWQFTGKVHVAAEPFKAGNFQQILDNVTKEIAFKMKCGRLSKLQYGILEVPPQEEPADLAAYVKDNFPDCKLDPKSVVSIP